MKQECSICGIYCVCGFLGQCCKTCSRKVVGKNCDDCIGGSAYIPKKEGE